MELSRGKIQRPQRVVIHGPEGIGKSTIASKFPDPVFIDKENGTDELDVVRTPVPSSWTMYTQLLQELEHDHQGRKTLVIDTADALESLCRQHICSELQITELGGNMDFGKSFNVHANTWARSLDQLTRIAMSGMHVVLLAHSMMRKFEEPNENGAYDRWELQLEKKTSAHTKQWADAVLFVNYKVYVVEDEKTHKKKGKGGKRVIFTTHHPCWDAKNRYDLPDEVELKWESIAHCFPPSGAAQTTTAAAAAATPVANPAPVAQVTPAPESKPKPSLQAPPSADFLRPLFDLMQKDQVSEHEVQLAVAKRGYYPQDTPLENYDPQFVAGKLVAHWDIVRKTVEDVRKEVAS